MKQIRYSWIFVVPPLFLVGCQQNSSESAAEIVAISIFADSKQKDELKSSLENYFLPFVAQPCELEVYPSVSLHLSQEKEQIIKFPPQPFDYYKAKTDKFGSSNILDMERAIGSEFEALEIDFPKVPVRIPKGSINDVLGQKSTETGDYLRSYVLREGSSGSGRVDKKSFKELVKQEDISIETVFQVDTSATKERIQDTLSKIVCGKINKETKRISETEIIVLDTKIIEADTELPPPTKPEPDPVPVKPEPDPVPVKPKPDPVSVKPKPDPVTPGPVGINTTPKAPATDADLNSQNCGKMMIELEESLKYSGDDLLGRTKPWTIAGHAKPHCLNDPGFPKYVELCYRANASMKSNATEKKSLNCN